MFEQSLYQQQPVQTPPESSDLFKHYEIKPWDKSSRLYKILGISAIGNILLILIIGQTSLLTMKGCDSPLVGRVCEVLDVVYVSSMLFGTDREYVDAAYDDTKIEDLEITFVDVTGVTPPLSYPEGYFQLANPNSFQASMDGMSNPIYNSTLPDMNLGGISQMPKFPTNGGNLLDTPPVLPQSNPNAISGNLPSFDSGSGSSYRPPQPRKTPRIKRYPANMGEVDDNAVAIVKPTPSPTPTPALPKAMTSEEVQATAINKKPLVDFADEVATKWETKEIDLNQPFTVVLNAVLAPDGSLDLKTSKFDVAKQKGDQKMIDVGKAALEALGKSGYLTYLKNLNVNKFVATLVQDDNQITVVITSAQKSPEMAKTVASGLNSYIAIGRTITENPSDERTLLDGAKVTSEDKNFILNFAVPKPIAQEMINRKLKEASAKKATQPKPSGNNPTKAEDKTAIK